MKYEIHLLWLMFIQPKTKNEMNKCYEMFINALNINYAELNNVNQANIKLKYLVFRDVR